MNKNFKIFFIALTASLFFISCQKNIEGTNTIIDPALPPTPSYITTKVTATLISGFVTDGNDIAVKDASVQIGTTTVLTDKYGYFEVRNIQVVQNAAMVTVNKTGFFKGIKTYIATANKAAFFRIKLIPKTIAGTVNGSTGGTVIVTGGLLLSFPANAIVNANTNAAYTGTVNVTAFKIDPTNADLPRIMPGDLRGLNTQSQLQLLTSYGMAAVELTGAGGELLQIATGKKATMTMPIAATLLATSPASIPLWYFDETIGLWKQEGTATKVGNNYVGDVSHFSFWNYDVPANYVQFNCTVVNTAGQPVQNAYVKISLVNNPSNAEYGYTDSSGYVSGAVPNNTQLKLEIFGNGNCSATVFSQTFSTTNSNISYGNVGINTVGNIANLAGSVKNCAGLPVTNGFIIVQEGNIYNRIALNSNGNYNFNKLVCSFPEQISLIGEDITNNQLSPVTNYIINTSGTNNIANIQACGFSPTQYVNCTINNIQRNYANFTNPVDSFGISVVNGSATRFDIYVNKSPYGVSNAVFFGLTTSGIGVGSLQNLIQFNGFPIPASSTIPNPIAVNITEFGNVGQFISGNFSGVIIGLNPTNTVYNVTCNFRVPRF